MSEKWENLVQNSELKKAKIERSREYIYSKILTPEQEDYEAIGWEFLSSYKDRKHIRMQKKKSIGELFENKVWKMFFDMGFTTMNRDSQFVISYSKTNPTLTKQIDVLAADEETVLVIECKSAESPGTTKDFKTEIEAFKGNIGEFNRELNAYFGKKISIKYIWATSNITLNKDEQRLADAGIIHFAEEEIEYYSELAKHLGSAAKYQLLGKIFANRTIPNMPSTVPAIQGKMGGHTYYSFSIEPERLLKISYVLHRSDANYNLMPTYQRIIKKGRLKQVRDFVDKGGFFPNSIIISIDAPKKGLQFDLKGGDTDSDTKLGILHLPQRYCSAYVIDGQHRLYGYTESEYAKTNSIPVVAFENLDREEQVRLFMEINENQKAVPKNLRNTLNADMLWTSDNYNERRKALRSRIAQQLGEDNKSPLFNRVLIGENSTSDQRFITMETIDKGLRDGLFLAKFDKDNKVISPGLFDLGEPSNDTAKNTIIPFLYLSFEYFKRQIPNEWNLNKDDSGILTNNTGIYALLRCFSDIVDFLNAKNFVNVYSENVDSIYQKCVTFYDCIISFCNSIEPELRQDIRRQYGENGSRNHWRFFQKAIREKIPDFNPAGLDDWWADNSKEFNEDSLVKLACIEKKAKELTLHGLKKIYGEDWLDNVPIKIRIKHLEEVDNANKAKKEEGNKQTANTWDYVTLQDCSQIAKTGSNWSDGFKQILARKSDDSKRITKEDGTKWLDDMFSLAKKIQKSNTSITRAEHEYITAISEWLNQSEEAIL